MFSSVLFSKGKHKSCIINVTLGMCFCVASGIALASSFRPLKTDAKLDYNTHGVVYVKGKLNYW